MTAVYLLNCATLLPRVNSEQDVNNNSLVINFAGEEESLSNNVVEKPTRRSEPGYDETCAKEFLGGTL